jgi:hypothetical protein
MPPWPGGAGRGSPRHRRGRADPGRQCEEHLATATARVEAMREREVGEKRAGPGTIPAYVRRADTSADVSRLAYMAAVAPYVRQPPDEHKLHTSV